MTVNTPAIGNTSWIFAKRKYWHIVFAIDCSGENPIFIEKPLVYYSDFSDYPRIGNTISYEDSEIILEQTIKKCQVGRNLKLSTIIKH